MRVMENGTITMRSFKFKISTNFTRQGALHEIMHMTISPSEETIIATSRNNQLYTIGLTGAEISKGEQSLFETLSQPFHYDQITGLDVCIRKPLVSTCSLDRTVRIWNYENK